MWLSKVEIEGFKSFPKRTVMEIHPNLTCICGANGAGKTNLLDAIGWCLADISPNSYWKEINKTIFSGSPTLPDADSAKVTLHFEKAKYLQPRDKSEFVVVRNFNSTGEAEYFLNGEKSGADVIRRTFSASEGSDFDYFRLHREFYPDYRHVLTSVELNEPSLREIFRAVYPGNAYRLPLELIKWAMESILKEQETGEVHDNLFLSDNQKDIIYTVYLMCGLPGQPFEGIFLLDELDASWNDKEKNRFARFIKRMSRIGQFIIVTHDYRILRAADLLYGVQMLETDHSELFRAGVGKDE